MVASVLLEGLGSGYASSTKTGTETGIETETYVSVLCSPGTTFITQLHELLKQRLETFHARSPEDALTTATTLLEHVQLLPYLDLAGLAETLSEVSGELFKMHQDHEQLEKMRYGSGGGSRRSVLLVEGMSTLLGSIHRRSGITEAAAMVSNILRTIRHLSRTYKDLFVLMELDVTSDIPTDGGDGLHSAFSSATGEVMRVAPGGILSGTVENAMDVIVCVHDGFGKTKPVQKRKRDGQPPPQSQSQPQPQPQPQTRIVEVVKDGVGGGVGEWCIWVQ